MADYIRRTDVIQMINESNAWHPECAHVLGPLRREIMNHQPANVRPVVRGEWNKSYADHEAFGVRPFFRYCSECHESTVYPYNFCPHCGADMRPEQRKEET